MKIKSTLLLTGLFAGFVAASTLADTVETARGLLKSASPSVVSVTAVVKMDMSNSGLPISLGSQSQEVDVAGVVLDSSGLTAVSLISLNPLDILSGGIKIKMGEDDDSKTLKPKTDVTQIKLHLSDGTQVPARLVFKDKELDLAFLVPDVKEGAATPKFTPIGQAKDASAAELDEIIVLSRLSKKLNYQPSIALGRISAVVTKPRRVYDIACAGVAGAGLPVFTADGQWLGMLLVTGNDSSEAADGLAGLGGMAREMNAVILPAAEITGLMDQAKKAAEKKSEAPKKDAEPKESK